MTNSVNALLTHPLSDSGTQSAEIRPTAPLSTTFDVFDAPAEQRWQQWVARGASRDRQTMARVRGLMMLGASLLLTALAIFFTLFS